jgi:hypothetical protein
MSFLNRLQQIEPHETCPQLLAAATLRYQDGFELLTCRGRHETGGIYLLGYVAEVILKVAIFRTSGFSDARPIDLKQLDAKIKTNLAGLKKSNLHDLKALADVLIAERQNQGRPFDPVFSGALQCQVGLVAAHWREYLRYRHTTPEETEWREVYQAVEWIYDNQTKLWS